MRATPLEFRLRTLIIAVILVVAIWSPGFRTRTLWSVLAEWLAPHLGGMLAASWLVIGIACALAVLAALLRTWATAYMSTRVVQDGNLHGDRVVASGPYRYMRNPLYLGAEMNFLALAFLVPWWSGIVAVVLFALFFWRLILAEEHALAASRGYSAYRSVVPAILPSLRPRIQASLGKPRWLQAFFGELYFWGTALSFLCFSATFNPLAILKWVAVSFGVSLIAHAFLRKS